MLRAVVLARLLALAVALHLRQRSPIWMLHHLVSFMLLAAKLAALAWPLVRLEPSQLRLVCFVALAAAVADQLAALEVAR